MLDQSFATVKVRPAAYEMLLREVDVLVPEVRDHVLFPFDVHNYIYMKIDQYYNLELVLSDRAQRWTKRRKMKELKKALRYILDGELADIYENYEPPFGLENEPTIDFSQL